MIRSRRIGGRPTQRSRLRAIHALGTAAPEIGQEARPGVLAGPEEDRVGVRSGFVGQRRHVQPAERDIGASGAVVIGEAIRAVRRRDVDLDHHQVGRIVEIERLDVLVLNLDFSSSPR